jgi:hypothetical protein
MDLFSKAEYNSLHMEVSSGIVATAAWSFSFVVPPFGASHSNSGG